MVIRSCTQARFITNGIETQCAFGLKSLPNATGTSKRESMSVSIWKGALFCSALTVFDELSGGWRLQPKNLQQHMRIKKTTNKSPFFSSFLLFSSRTYAVVGSRVAKVGLTLIAFIPSSSTSSRCEIASAWSSPPSCAALINKDRKITTWGREKKKMNPEHFYK